MIDWEEQKNKFRLIAYCPKKDEIFLIKEKYIFHNKGTKRWCYRYADKKLFGKDVYVSKTKTWFYVGEL